MARSTNSTTFAGHANAGVQNGVFSGTMTNHFYATAAAAPLAPKNLIPFYRDLDFVERAVFDEKWQQLSVSARRVGIIGLGGVGKTQLAIEYACRRRDADPDSWVFWAHASSAARFEESYRRIAQHVGISNWADPEADVLNLVYDWLMKEENGRWTMVVDNADDEEVVFGGMTALQEACHNAKPIAKYLPSCQHGSIVVTSRDRQVVQGLIEYPEHIIKVRPMSDNNGRDAVTLLRRKLAGDTASDGDVHDLVRELDYLPLAITQAAAYINQLEGGMTVAQYRARLLAANPKRDKLLQQPIRDPRRDIEAINSIITTWHISFEHIRRTCDSAARLLALMSQFNREGIPRSLLEGQYYATQQMVGVEDNPRQDGNSLMQQIQRWFVGLKGNESSLQNNIMSTPAADLSSDFEEDVRLLQMYCLVDVDATNEGYKMHGLVQDSMCGWLTLHGELQPWRDRCVSVLDNSFPTVFSENLPICQQLFPHVETLLQYHISEGASRRKQAAIFCRGSWLARLNRRYDVAHQMATISLDLVEQELGERHPDTLTSINSLAGVLESQGQYVEAEALNRRVLTGYKKTLSDSHPAKLAIISILAPVRVSRHQYAEAEVLCRRTLAWREKMRGMSHLETLQSVMYLGLLLHGQKKFGDALLLYNRAIQGFGDILGASHELTQQCQREKQRLLQDMDMNTHSA